MTSMTNINTLAKKGKNIMPSFDNGIFHTVKHDTIDGVVWVLNSQTGERITFVRTQSDLDWTIEKLMKRRLGL
jgi:hypothetical protein